MVWLMQGTVNGFAAWIVSSDPSGFRMRRRWWWGGGLCISMMLKRITILILTMMMMTMTSASPFSSKWMTAPCNQGPSTGSLQKWFCNYSTGNDKLFPYTCWSLRVWIWFQKKMQTNFMVPYFCLKQNKYCLAIIAMKRHVSNKQLPILPDTETRIRVQSG